MLGILIASIIFSAPLISVCVERVPLCAGLRYYYTRTLPLEVSATVARNRQVHEWQKQDSIIWSTSKHFHSTPHAKAMSKECI